VRRITLLHLDATGWGVLAAAANRWLPQTWERARAAKAAAGAALMAVGVMSVQAMFGVLPGPLGAALTAWPRFPVALSLTCTGLGTFLALPAISRLRAPPPWARRAVERLSNYSYSVYLCHFPVMFLLAELVAPEASDLPLPRGTLWALTALWLALVLLVAAGVHHAFEKPVSDLRERFTRKVDASPFGPATPP
jgi:peptidoglycan/LPS O-acetylase OafA/YrhL